MSRLLLVPVVVVALFVGVGMGAAITSTGQAAQENTPDPELQALRDRVLRLEDKALPERVSFDPNINPWAGFQLDQTQLFSLVCESYNVENVAETFVLSCNRADFAP